MNKKTTVLTFLLFSLLLAHFNADAQRGVQLNTPASFEGYTLIQEGARAYLMDNCGGLINTWIVYGGFHLPKLLENGHILYYTEDGVVEKDWDGNVVNEVFHEDIFLKLIYEVVLLPNGNYLSVGRRRVAATKFEEIGYNLEGVDPDQIDVVVELDRNTGKILWEWQITDHVIQQRDSSLPNYGILSENPQLLNMDAISLVDWTHSESFMINGMDYNPELDQIILSIRKMSEIVIIDHSTTTEEAAGHVGGASGKGGDILYRWGNPQNYDRGTPEDRVLYFQHNPNWITEGDRKGQIICFNNGLDRPDVYYALNYSTVPIIQPPMDGNGNYELNDDSPFLPLQAPLEYSEVHTGTSFISRYTSGAQYLRNGNIFITVGGPEQLIEINPEGEIIWDYKIPAANQTYRTKRYSYDYPGFEGKDMTPDGLLPFDDSEYDCQLFDLTTSTQSLEKPSNAFKVSFSWNDNNLNIINKQGSYFEVNIFNLSGQSIIHQSANTEALLNLDHLPKGMYVARITDKGVNEGHILKIIIP